MGFLFFFLNTTPSFLVMRYEKVSETSHEGSQMSEKYDNLEFGHCICRHKQKMDLKLLNAVKKPLAQMQNSKTNKQNKTKKNPN